MSEPTPKEKEFLKFVYNYIREYQKPPDTMALKLSLLVEKTRISDLKRSLKKKGYLAPNTNEVILLSKAVQYIEELNTILEATTTPLHLPLLGEVKAGETRPDELVAHIDNWLYKENAPTEPVPYITSSLNVFLLKVIGQSMEHEGIFEGDYLITEQLDKSNVKSGDLLVTRYLSLSIAEVLSDPAITIDDLTEEYLGPVVKYCSIMEEQKIDGTRNIIYRLGWRRSADNSSYTIKAIDIQPYGKVIGVYRRLPT